MAYADVQEHATKKICLVVTMEREHSLLAKLVNVNFLFRVKNNNSSIYINTTFASHKAEIEKLLKNVFGKNIKFRGGGCTTTTISHKQHGCVPSKMKTAFPQRCRRKTAHKLVDSDRWLHFARKNHFIILPRELIPHTKAKR